MPMSLSLSLWLVVGVGFYVSPRMTQLPLLGSCEPETVGEVAVGCRRLLVRMILPSPVNFDFKPYRQIGNCRQPSRSRAYQYRHHNRDLLLWQAHFGPRRREQHANGFAQSARPGQASGRHRCEPDTHERRRHRPAGSLYRCPALRGLARRLLRQRRRRRLGHADTAGTPSTSHSSVVDPNVAYLAHAAGCDDGDGTMCVWDSQETDRVFYVDGSWGDAVIEENQFPLVFLGAGAGHVY